LLKGKLYLYVPLSKDICERKFGLIRNGMETTLLVIAYFIGQELNIVPSPLDHATVEYTVQATLSFKPTAFGGLYRSEASFDDVNDEQNIVDEVARKSEVILGNTNVARELSSHRSAGVVELGPHGMRCNGD
jgi:hypothetical protein